jgi:hypothetical protein
MLQKILFSLLTVICLIALLPNLAQDKPDSRPDIEKLIDAKEYKKADSILKRDVALFASQGKFDTFLYYLPLAGKIANAQYGSAKAEEAVAAQLQFLKSKNVPPSLMMRAYRAAADFFGNIGQNQNGYDASKEALVYTMMDPAPAESEVARCEYNLGSYAHRLGNVGLSHKHHRKALYLREANPNTEPEDIYLSCNAVGGLMWYASKYDSAALYYNKALDALKRMPDTDVNKYFRPANIQNNLAALYSAEGKTTEGIRAMQSTIDNFQKFIASKTPDTRKQSATEGLFEAIDNLAGIYREVGDYGKGGDLLRYSYSQKFAKLDREHPGIFISEILLGQHYNSVHEYDTAMHYLTKGLNKLEKAEGDYLFWAADAYYTKALIFENRKDTASAMEAYARSESLYEKSYQGQYDNVYMDFLRSASLFYARNHDYPKAIERANKVYQYLVSLDEGSSLQAFYQLLNIAEINYLTNRYKEAVSYAANALTTVNAKMKDGLTLLDSVKMEVFKPKAMLIAAKSEYVLAEKKDTVFLIKMAGQLGQALDILEKRKVLIDDAASINILISDHGELIDFTKKIEMELYELTGQSIHLDRFINLHESALYNRIRSRLDQQQAIMFSHLPAAVHQEEKQLKAAITTSLQVDKPNTELMKDYIRSVAQWEVHLEKVKRDYPMYYNMRYATIFRSLPELQSSIPDNSSLVRYFFVDTNLLALVVDKKEKKIVHLTSKGLEERVNTALWNAANEKVQLPILQELHEQVWKPLAPFIRHQKVTIIPDGILYNLSFDMLAVKPVLHYRELLTNSLLSSFTFSYHYSLFMLNQGQIDEDATENYVAFAPGFSDQVKSNYLSVTRDSVNLDYRYLQLLPQPNTNKLAKKIRKMIGGDIFLDENSTQTSFRKNAGGHKIIHIGTHARYDNIHPEQSGLIFAKSTSSAEDNNFLSLYEIYNCDMRSDLTLLTACESGKPGYQDGEGMVSLAHAFNYAGSRRILTALWKIDEQSSSQITELFVSKLQSGLTTDEALRQAKLKYLSQAQGRMLAPAYWAGMVIMGEPGQLSLPSSSGRFFWIAGGILLILIALAVFVNSRNRSRSKVL